MEDWNISVAKVTRLNEQITGQEVRLIGLDGENVGVVNISEAKQIAQEAELDLVEIAPNATPPVCRVMDYGKFRFQQSKKAQVARKKQKLIHVKEIKFRPGTDEGDYQVKLRKIIGFLTNGDKTKVTVRFRGREMMHQGLGGVLLDRIEKDLEPHGEVEQRPKLEGRQLVMVFTSLRKK